MCNDGKSADPINEELRRKFEAAWLEGKPEPIQHFLPSEQSCEYLGTLEELIHIEIEFAWKASVKDPSSQKPPSLESYLDRFPALHHSAIIQRLVEQEHRIRWRYGDQPSIESYQERFPDVILKIPEAQPLSAASLPHRIAHYRILNLIGEGGMGTVYLAEQDNPRRTVALKIIKPGYTSPILLKRLEHEAQVLGHLHHPCIAQVHEAGIQQDKHGHNPTPFIAMEYVDGEILTAYCQNRSLSIEDRLELVARICDAVHHAHQRGVIHRDLKPANILVEEDVGVHQPKILDFGVARVTNTDLQTTTLKTHAGQLLGTLQYMSPEQASGDPSELDIRSDVYSLGVILYEILTGKAPYDLQGVMIHEAVRRIREEDPTPLGTVHRTLHGDLSTIMAKAMEKTKDRRYQSAAELGADLRRYLASEPILAHPPSTVYQLRKFARRHRALVASVLAAGAALLIGTSLALWQAVRATHAMEEAQLQRDEALRQARITKMVNEFLNRDLLNAPNPWQYDSDATVNKDVKVIEVVERASKRIQGQFVEEPLVAAAIHASLGTTFRGLGENNSAEPHCLKALELRRSILGEDAPQTLIAMSQLALLYRAQGRTNDSEKLQRQVCEARHKIFGEEHPETLESMNHMASLYSDMGRIEEAAALQEKVVDLNLKLLGKEHEQTLISLNNLAGYYHSLKRYEESEELYNQQLAVMISKYGNDHAETLNSRANLARLYGQMGQYGKAESLLLQVIKACEKTLGGNHPNTLGNRNSLAVMYFATGRIEESVDLLEVTLKLWRRNFSDEHQKTIWMGIDLACFKLKLGQLDESAELFKQYIEPCREILGNEHFQTMKGLMNLACLYRLKGLSDEAITLFHEILEIQQKVLGEKDSNTLVTASNLGEQYLVLGRFKEAEPYLRITIDNVREAFPPEDEFIAIAIYRYGLCLAWDKQILKAEPVLLEAYNAALKAAGEKGIITMEIIKALIDVYKDLGDSDSEEKWRRHLDAAGKSEK